MRRHHLTLAKMAFDRARFWYDRKDLVIGDWWSDYGFAHVNG